jgi:hypothetical protein
MFWHYISKQIGPTQYQEHNLEIRTTNKAITNLLQISEKINSFIETVENIKKDNNFVPSINVSARNQHYCHNTMFPSPVTANEVESIMKGLKGSSSTGFDEIPERIVKSSVEIKKQLDHSYNISFQTGIFPNELKVARFIPIFKRGERHDLANYRPIPILLVFLNY